MAGFNSLSLELKWRVFECLPAELVGAPPYPWEETRFSERFLALQNMRLVDRKNAVDLAPALCKLYPPLKVMFNEFGVRQLQWMGRSLLAPYIRELQFMSTLKIPYTLLFSDAGTSSNQAWLAEMRTSEQQRMGEEL